jgi:hypothetical protein
MRTSCGRTPTMVGAFQLIGRSIANGDTATATGIATMPPMVRRTQARVDPYSDWGTRTEMLSAMVDMESIKPAPATKTRPGSNNGSHHGTRPRR